MTSWLTLVLCVGPLALGWLVAVAAAVELAHGAWAAGVRRADLSGAFASELGMALLSLGALAVAALPLAALTSALVRRARNRESAIDLRRWELCGLRLGALVALALLVLFVAQPVMDAGGLCSLFVIGWALVTAFRLARASGRSLVPTR